MNDLINALQRLENGDHSPVLLRRIDEIAFDTLVFTEGRLEGQVDFYNVELLKNYGYKVEITGASEDGTLGGDIVTSKGKVHFG